MTSMAIDDAPDSALVYRECATVKEMRKLSRLEKNRRSAAASRLRRKVRLSALQARIESLERSIERLGHDIRARDEQITYLRNSSVSLHPIGSDVQGPRLGFVSESCQALSAGNKSPASLLVTSGAASSPPEEERLGGISCANARSSASPPVIVVSEGQVSLTFTNCTTACPEPLAQEYAHSFVDDLLLPLEDFYPPSSE